MGGALTARIAGAYMALVDKAARPVDGAWLAAFRVSFGLVIAASMARFIAYGWVERFFVEPAFHFKYWGFSWVQALPGPWMHALFMALGVLALCVAAGFLFRVSAVLLALGLAYFQLIDVSTYLNHYYLAALLAALLACSPAARLWSLDAWARARRTGRRQPPVVAAGVLWLLRLQVAVVYVGAGLAKAQGDWLLHAQPLRIWLAPYVDLPVLGAALTWPATPLLASWAGFLFDLTIVVWLLLVRTRVAAYCALVVFHVVTRALFPIGMFPFIMTSAALVFFSPSWPRNAGAVLRRWVSRGRATSVPPRVAEVGPWPRARKPSWRAHAVCALAAVYCVLQVLLPLRHLAYGEGVLWHEQGMRFSWRVMVRAKGGSTEFEVEDPASGARRVIHPRSYLTGMQETEMSGQPDLILQLAHHIRDDMRRRGLGDVAVYARTRVSLNGRRGATLVDPEVDLAVVRDGLGRADWVLPAPAAPPPHTRPVE